MMDVHWRARSKRGSSSHGVGFPAVPAVLVAVASYFPTACLAQFANVTTFPLNVSTGSVSGVSWGDFDQDGDLDLYVTDFVAFGGGKLFRHDTPGTFSNVTSSALAGGRTASASFGDYDEDGDLDLYLNSTVTTVGSTDSRLLRNDRGTVFEEIGTPGVNGSSGGRTTTWLDFDGDGDLDLSAAGIVGSKLFRNSGTGFTNIATAFPLNENAYGLTWGDYDGDGDPDAYRTNGGPGLLARNDGGGVFNQAGTGAVNVLGLQAEWGDFDNDGDLDLFVGSDSNLNSLLRNDGNGAFANVASGAVLGTNSTRTSTWGDFDNDGDLDLIFTNVDLPSVLLRNDGGATFTDVSSQLLTNSVDAWGCAWADYDNDGDLDLYIGQNSGTNALLRNDRPATNHWLHVKLVGTISNRDGSGARLTLVAGGVSRMREMVEGGQGWCSQGSSLVEFGLGSATSVTSLTVRWPSGISQNVTVSGVDQVITVTEPEFAPSAAFAGGFQPGAVFELVLDTFGANVTQATLFYGPAGSGTFPGGPSMIIDSGNDQMSAAVSGAHASENGLEYWVFYSLNGGQFRAFPRGAGSAPAFLPANLGTRAQPAAAPANEHVLFSVPFVPTTATLGSVLEDDLGPYDNTKWRFGRFSPSGDNYLEAGAAPVIAPGRGFWIIERTPVVLDAAGTSTNTVGGTSIPIDPGWNQIGQPYLFPIPTSAVDRSNAPNVTNRFVGRESGAYVDQTTLLPWKGYWVFNGGTGTQTIVIPGQVGLSPLPRATPLAQSLDWGIEAIAHGGHSADFGNFAGVSISDPAEVSFPEPPGMPGTVRVFFARDGEAPSQWTTDVRAVGSESESFHLVVEAGETTTLTFDGFESLPEGRRAILVNDEHLVAIDLDRESSLPIPAGRVVNFRLVVGTESSLALARDGQGRPPIAIQMASPRPNPFTGATTIAFALPSSAAVDLAVYDVTGRLVRRLAAGVRTAGIHRVEWNGTDDEGTRASSGVYFAKLRAGTEEKIEKVLLVK